MDHNDQDPPASDNSSSDSLEIIPPLPSTPPALLPPAPEPVKFDHNEARKDLIRRLEDLRSAKVFVYMDSASTPHRGEMHRYIFEHLRDLHGRPHDRVALVIGTQPTAYRDNLDDLDHALRTMALLREFAREVEVFVPSHGYGVGTLLALGADRIFMHPLGSLGNLACAEALANVRSFLTLMHEAVPSPATPTSDAMQLLTLDLSPSELGARRYTLTRLRSALRELIAGRLHRRKESQNQALFNALLDPSSPLAHPIDRRKAKDLLGLPIESSDHALESTLWELFSTYERALGWSGSASSAETAITTILESLPLCHTHVGPDEDAAQAGGWKRVMNTHLH